jgi:D-sedoheptulose 7-phosphate isomerase
MSFTRQFMGEVGEIAARLDADKIESLAGLLAETRSRQGRLFVLGVGGSAGNASHAASDFRKLAGIDAYAPTDNVTELTARTNDEGWATVFEGWLRISRVNASDMLLVLSVTGGDIERQVSVNLVRAIECAKQAGSKIAGIVGRADGYTARAADVCIVVPVVNAAHVTPHSEAFQAVVWHCLVSHPLLKIAATKWESLATTGKRE